MQTFFCPDQLLHTPQQFMRLGRLMPATDLPSRAESLQTTLHAAGVPVHSPPEIARTALEAVHTPQYLDYLETAYERWQDLRRPGVEPGIEVLPNQAPYAGMPPGQDRPPCPSPALAAQTGYYLGDLSCPLGPHSWRSILRSAHSAVAAAETVIGGARAAYALCRPSGHHAHRDRASGFCFVNNNACAAARLQQAFGRVAVLDVDAHHGDGTQNIFYANPEVLTVSIHADPAQYFPFYTGYAHERGTGAGLGCNLNLPLAHGSGNAEFLQALAAARQAITDFRPEALVLALGFDTYKDDPISVLRLDFDAYRATGRLLRELALPVVVVQEGGYLVEAIGPGLAAFLEGLHG
ncbi:histone deacetylase family protein [Acidovorax sp. D2M1]|uniref:Histone deacetylase family protein n=1 Tax=Acidovorax benzenivorans TaxID=2987520 RepID=A0ABT5RZ63_9BURK|nr:histone deacetylase family protein [Acidovorax benzenivorans]MDD2178387.1 histone deacetylase family protein [Acidovorax benzenivorans]